MPLRDRADIFLLGDARDEAALAGDIGRSAQRHVRIGAVDLLGLQPAAHHQVVAAPGVVGAALRVHLEGTAEVAHRERRHLPVDAQRHHRLLERRHRHRQVRHQVGVGAGDVGAVHLVGVIVEAALLREEDLAVVAQAVARLDHARDAVELARDVAGQRRARRRVDEEGVHRARRRQDRVGGGDLAVGGGEAARGRLGHRPQPRGIGEGVERRLARLHRIVGACRRIARARERAARRQHQRAGLRAQHRQLRSRDRHHRRQRRGAVHAIGHPAHEAVEIGAARAHALPVRLLVRMAHQVQGTQIAPRLVERLGERLVERARVEHHAQLPRIPYRLQRRHGGVQPHRRSVERHQARLRQRQRAPARGGIGAVAAVGRHHHVPAVVAARQEDAHHRAIGRRALRQARRQTELSERRERARARRHAQEIAPALLNDRRHLTGPPETEERSPRCRARSAPGSWPARLGRCW